MAFVIGIDLGATWLKAALADRDGHILRKAMVRTRRDREALASQLVAIVKGLLEGLSPSSVAAIGVGAIGPLDLASGAILSPSNLPISRLEVVSLLEEALGVPTYLLNDCTAACYGEWTFGIGRGLRNIAYVGIGTGIGGGAIVDGHLLLGEGGNAAEVGHFTVDAQGRLRCGCGSYGHWEAYCSGSGIPRFLRLWLEEEGMSSTWPRGGQGLTAKEALELAKEHSLTGFLEELAKLNAIGLAITSCAFSPSIITIGGSVALANPDVAIERPRAYLPKFCFSRVPEVVVTPLGPDATLYGAIALALRPPRELLRAQSHTKVG